ncbi:MAG: carbohydrate ABC transporter permease [Clostridia bacterium]|nr:carbohydrate ABC transporter permease [Clostridia bacterium]
MDFIIQCYILFANNWWLPLLLTVAFVGAFIALLKVVKNKKIVKLAFFYALMVILFIVTLFLFLLHNSYWLMFIPVYSVVLITAYGSAKFFVNNPKARKIIDTAALYTLLVHLAAFFLFPFLYMVFKSFMSQSEAMGQINPDGTGGAVFMPSIWHAENYAVLFGGKIDILTGLWNTLCVIVIGTVGTVVSSCMCAYGFARGEFRGKGFWFTFMMATVMLPAMVTQVPLYILFDQVLHITNTWIPLVIGAFFGGGALNIFLANQFVRGISRELDEAAKIDGAGKMRIFFQIILPLLKPIMIYMAVNCIMGYWRDFDTALIYIGNTYEEWHTLALSVYYQTTISGGQYSYPQYQMAAGVIMTIPMAIVFLVFQRQLVDGVSMTGGKE